MPPANSRAASPPADPAHRTGTPPSYMSALRELESPVNSDVLNLAATLTTQAEDGTEEPGFLHLRTGLDPHDEWRIEHARERQRRAEERGEDRERRERLRRVINRLSHMSDPPAYSDRIPSQNNLYDWSPANEADDEEELDQILAELRREQPSAHPEILRVLGRSQLDAERESRMRPYSPRLLSSNQPSQSTDSSLRSAAILQSVRRHPRLSARARDYLRHTSERDSANRSLHTSEARDRSTPSRAMSPSERSRFEINRQAALQRSAERQSNAESNSRPRGESYRHSYLSQSWSPSSTPCIELEATVKYLSQIRESASPAESWTNAEEAGIFKEGFVFKSGDVNIDFLLETASLPPPAQSSWLTPGAVLSGSQHAHTITTTITPINTPSSTLYRFRDERSMNTILFDPSRPWQNASQISPRDLRALASSNGQEVVTTHSPQQDHWPVRVTIHAVDYDKMTLSATMEAYNVPSHPHTHQQSLLNPTPPVPRTASITTYLEGEILDFNNHTLLTESFKSTPQNDATHWRKLPPFQKYSNDELARKFVSRRFLEEELGGEWILMRWKERCFVKSLNQSTSDPRPSQSFSNDTNPSTFSSINANPSSNMAHASFTSSRENYPLDTVTTDDQTFDGSGYGLTISGFYYVALRRSDGALEGLYYDPQSSPYQHLKLESMNAGVFPAWSFR